MSSTMSEEFAKEIIDLAKERGLNTYELCKAAETAQEMACKSVSREASMEDLFMLCSIMFFANYDANSDNNFDFFNTTVPFHK